MNDSHGGTPPLSTDANRPEKVSAAALERFCIDSLKAAGADQISSEDAARAMLHASLHGVDSHGVRLMPHYEKALRGGRLNGTPAPLFTKTRAGTGTLDADNAQGARAMYEASRHAAQLAAEAGIGAVGIKNSSHFGAAGAYTIELAKKGLAALVFGNSDSFVRLHDGASRFHGTNPISVAFPAEGNPWLLDMATSAVPYNRVQLYQSLGVDLPVGIASDEHGVDVRDPNDVDMLAPLGGDFGFKGAALGGVAEILSSVINGMRIGPDILPMGGPDFETPREMGAFVIAIDPEAFIGRALFAAGMAHYLKSLRESPAREGARVMAPGDREWEEAARRRVDGIAIDPVTRAAFDDITRRTGLVL